MLAIKLSTGTVLIDGPERIVKTRVAEYNDKHESDGKFGSKHGSAAKGKDDKKVEVTGSIVDDIEALGDLPESKSIEFDPGGDKAMTLIAGKLGFNKKPGKYTASEADQAISEGWTEMYRGYRGESAQKWKKSYSDDANPRIGFGVFGSGTYMTPSKDVGLLYGDLNPKNVARYLINPKAKTISYEKAKKAMLKSYDSAVESYHKLPTKRKTPGLLQSIRNIHADAGRWAAVSGYDAITYKGSNGGTEMSVINRGMVGVVI